jgi:hypothetical protein
VIISRPAFQSSLSLSLQARELYGSVCELQPLASQGWLEWAKMEEECGQVKFSLKILREGLHAPLDISTNYSYMRKVAYNCHFFHLIYCHLIAFYWHGSPVYLSLSLSTHCFTSQRLSKSHCHCLRLRELTLTLTLTLTEPLTGLSQCKLNEGLLTKAIKQQEKLHDVDAARGMLSALRHESIERVWKV